MSWSSADARARLPTLLKSLDDGPQVITVRGREVAAVVDIEEYRAFVRWREQGASSVGGALDELRSILADSAYELVVPERRDRAQPLAEALGELPR
jgi:prevent-host-death family protein